jgi:chromosome segregation ATPase
LQSEFDALTARLAEAEARAAAAEQAATSSQQSIDEWKTKYEKADEELGELGARIAAETMARAMAEADLDAARSRTSDSAELDALRAKAARVADLERELEAAREEAAAFKQRSQADYADLSDNMARDMETMQKKLEAASSRNDDLEAQLAEARNRVQDQDGLEDNYKLQIQARDAELVAAKALAEKEDGATAAAAQAC